MIKALRKRFVITAMLALLILIAILIGCVTALGYVYMEQSTDSMLRMLSEQRPHTESREEQRRPAFGYQIGPDDQPPGSQFTVDFDADGTVVHSALLGLQDLDEQEAAALAAQVLSSGKTGGKIGSFKYLATALEGGGTRVVFIDNASQVRMLLSTLRYSCLVGLGCMLLMFLILLPLSKRAMRTIEENMARQRRFVTDAGHEIKTPLAIIQANVDALELHAGQSKWSRNIRGQTERMSGLMERLLRLARSDEGASELPMRPVDFSALVAGTAEDFAEPAGSRSVRLSAQVPPGIMVKGSRDELEQLVGILLDNAVKYADADGSISVRLSREGKKCRLHVKNTVSRLPDVPPGTLFDRFYRADAARTQKGGGYGIGLSIALSSAQLHGGQLEAAYEDGPSICFLLTLPLS